MVTQWIAQFAIILGYLLGGIIGSISELRAQKSFAEVGQQINTVVLAVLLWCVIVTPLLYIFMVR
jgi:ABC-type dipeptide/oligopeptide/nickel transport system permease component